MLNVRVICYVIYMLSVSYRKQVTIENELPANMYGINNNLYTVRYVYNCHILLHSMYACTMTI